MPKDGLGDRGHDGTQAGAHDDGAGDMLSGQAHFIKGFDNKNADDRGGGDRISEQGACQTK